jgi:hypothetical protein
MSLPVELWLHIFSFLTPYEKDNMYEEFIRDKYYSEIKISDINLNIYKINRFENLLIDDEINYDKINPISTKIITLSKNISIDLNFFYNLEELILGETYSKEIDIQSLTKLQKFESHEGYEKKIIFPDNIKYIDVYDFKFKNNVNELTKLKNLFIDNYYGEILPTSLEMLRIYFYNEYEDLDLQYLKLKKLILISIDGPKYIRINNALNYLYIGSVSNCNINIDELINLETLIVSKKYEYDIIFPLNIKVLKLGRKFERFKGIKMFRCK